MSVKREMAKRLGVDLHILHNRLENAETPDEISEAAVKLGCKFNEQLPFIIECLKEFGGIKPH